MLTVQEIAEAVNGRLIGTPVDGRPATSVVVDSRQVSPGSLFVALKGEKHDGHEYLVDAFAKGARAALVEQIPGGPNARPEAQRLPLILVQDSLAALQQLASYWRRKLGLTIVGVTGSVGKTTTKEVISAVLEQRFSVLKSEGNLNTEIGMPLNLLRATPKHQVAVLEMAMYDLGEIRQLARIALPNVGVVTNVGPTHLQRLGTIERIALAKGELVEELPAEGFAILNYDDHRVRAMSSRTKGRVVYYGLDAGAEYHASDVQGRGLQGIEFDLAKREQTVHVRMPLLGLHSVHAALAATAVGGSLGMDLEEIAAGLHEVSSALRLIVEAGINGSTIIDDSYNASPASTLAALNLLSELEGRKVAVLGDMLELGSFSEEGHRMVGRRAADVVDHLVVVGPLSALTASEAVDAGIDSSSVFVAGSNQEAIARLTDILRPGDCVLAKGSRGMHLEEIVEALRCPMP